MGRGTFSTFKLYGKGDETLDEICDLEKKGMPRKSRIDAPGALHHVIARGIGKQKIFDDDLDRNHFLERLGTILVETQT